VLAVDLPSGLDADTGQVLGDAPQADLTLTLGLPKPGLALEPGRSLAGRVLVARIGIADEAPGVVASTRLWTHASAGARLPERPAHGHKGSFGHVLVVAGSTGKSGAAALAAQGAARAGAGLVTIACPAGLNDVIEALSLEAMTAPLPDTQERAISAKACEAALSLAASRDAVVLGPGLGNEAETVAFVRAFVEKLERPIVIDADGLNALAATHDVLKRRRAASILTPHPGEAGRFLGIAAADVNRDRIGAARALAERTGAIVVLKGAATVTASPDGDARVNATGGPALGSGGTGDVLAGVVGALLGQGCSPFEAAALGAHLHGMAGDLEAEAHGASGVLAGDVARRLPDAAERLRAAAQERNRHGRGGRSGLLLRFPEP
jgi:NAD(P)H-hydrate epimerase